MCRWDGVLGHRHRVRLRWEAHGTMLRNPRDRSGKGQEVQRVRAGFDQGMSEPVGSLRLGGMMKIENSNIVTAFAPSAIGTRVTDAPSFLAVLEKAIGEHDFSAD